MSDWKITKTMVVPSPPLLGDDAKRRLEEGLRRHIEASIMDAMTSTVEQPAPPPLTLKSIARSMAEATFDAQIIISDYVPTETTNEDGTKSPVDAFRIDNTALPDWDMRCRIAQARGEPPPHKVTIVFPSAEKAMEAVALATRADDVQ